MIIKEPVLIEGSIEPDCTVKSLIFPGILSMERVSRPATSARKTKMAMYRTRHARLGILLHLSFICFSNFFS